MWFLIHGNDFNSLVKMEIKNNSLLNFGFQEPETEICSNMLEAIKECVQVCFIIY